MGNNLSHFCMKMTQGPAFLLLGQDYLRSESEADPFLSEIVRKYGKSDGQPLHYGQIFQGQAHYSIEAALAWMQERCDRISVPHWLTTVASFAWNGIYTSAIDTIWLRAFRAEWRELQPLFEEKYRPIDPRNRSKLHCTFLFGCVNRTEEDKRPPLTRFDWLKRKQVAVALARRLPEIISPFGTLVIEGYAGERDWLLPEDLLPVLDELNLGQVHVFSATEELKENPYISEMVQRGKVALYTESLATYLVRGEEAGFLQLGKRPEEEERGRHIRLGETVLTVPTNIWNQVSRSATVLDDSMLAPLPSISNEKRYREFRDFLSDSGTKPLWSGYGRGFAFQRGFEKKLRLEVDRQLKSKELQNEPIILHGQTGTGKTVALGALAYKIREESRYPVLFIERKSQRPLSSDIDAFCKWAEDFGASSNLIVWDGMLEDDEQYHNLLQYLVGRGRKAVVVGSCYRLSTVKKNFIEAPAQLGPTEIPEFIDFLNDREPSLGKLLQQRIEKADNTFLVALYRLLPPTRAGIRSGIVKEVGFAEQEMSRKAQEMAPILLTTLGHAFWEVGLITKEQIMSLGTREVGGEKVSEPEELVALIMVPGQFGLQVPLELLLHALGKKWLLNFADLLRDLDILRWSEDAVGNIVVGPRHSLEARLVVQARLGGAGTEIAFAKQLLIEVRDEAGYADNVEVQFAIDLVRSMGPNGLQAEYYAPYFQEMSETLGKLRTERGVQSPRLMLQEASLLREAVVRQSKSGLPLDDAETILDRSETTLSQALDLLDGERKNNKLRSAILVELAATIGSRARHILDYSVHPDDATLLFREARSHLFKSRAEDPENYYPIDVFAWITKDLLESSITDLQMRAEAEADILHIFEIAEAEDFGIVQQERFHRRRMQIAQLLGKQQLSDEAFKSLIALGSSAGYYLRASHMVGEWAGDSELTAAQRKRCQNAVGYLEENREAIVHDGRCLYLLLRLWWLTKAGKPIFYSERQTVPFSHDDWQHCLQILLDLMAADESYITPSLRFLYGLSTFHLGEVESSFEIFRELERESDQLLGRRRIIRSFVASTPRGQPRAFRGTVTWVDHERNRGDVYVEELRRNVRFIPRDFNLPDIQKGEVIDRFHLAFNFIGPIADPPGYFRP